MDTAKHEFSLHLAQGTTGTFRPLEEKTSSNHAASIHSRRGRAQEHERPSDLQLAALSSWLAPQVHKPAGNHPYVDFGVWGPFDANTAKDRAYSAMIMVRPGEYQRVQLKGLHKI